MRLRRADSLMKNLKIVAYNFTGYTQQAGNQENYETWNFSYQQLINN